ncbi:MAG: hypothetical protein ACKO69_07790, partial [Limnohabitans sp.]
CHRQTAVSFPSVLLQCFEYARITASTDAHGVWAWQVQRADIPDHPTWLKRSLDWLYQPAVYKLQLWVRAFAAVALMVTGNHLSIAVLLFVGNLLLLIRWRGAFNGGSDFMTLITATGLLIAQVVEIFTDAQIGWTAGLGYIAIQTLSSYFVSGWVKLKRPEWRQGEALLVFLNSGLYGPLKNDSVFRRPAVALVCSWAFIVWEGLFPLVLVFPDWTSVFVVVALLFHFLVFWFFGLNRFFWAWAANLGSLFFLGHYLSSIY